MEPMTGDQWFMICLALVLVGGIVATSIVTALCKAVMYYSHARWVGTDVNTMDVDGGKTEVA